MSRRLRVKIPAARSLLEPRIVNADRELCARQSRQKHYYDRGTKPLLALQQGDQVLYRKRRLWKEASVLGERPEPRSYTIRNAHVQIRCNRRQLYKITATPMPARDYDTLFNASPPTTSASVHPQTASQHGSQETECPSTAAENASTRVSSFGRPIVRPAKLNDYIEWCPLYFVLYCNVYCITCLPMDWLPSTRFLYCCCNSPITVATLCDVWLFFHQCSE